MPRWKKISLISCAVFAGFLAFDVLSIAISDGAFPLHVSLEPRGNRKLAKVSAQAVMRKEWANLIPSDPSRLELNLKAVVWVEGESFTVLVPCGRRQSGFGRELSYFQFELLVLLLEYPDGTREYVTAEIPDGRVLRAVTVGVP